MSGAGDGIARPGGGYASFDRLGSSPGRRTVVAAVRPVPLADQPQQALVP